MVFLLTRAFARPRAPTDLARVALTADGGLLTFFDAPADLLFCAVPAGFPPARELRLVDLTVIFLLAPIGSGASCRTTVDPRCEQKITAHPPSQTPAQAEHSIGAVPRWPETGENPRTMLRRLILCSALTAVVVLPPAAAHAKGNPSAKTADKDGQKLEKQKKWDEAKSAYEKALELDDKPDTRLRLAGVEDKLGNLVEASEQVKKVLDAKGLSGAVRAKAKKLQKSLEKRTPTLTFDLPKGFSGSVKIDDQVIPQSELGGPVPANPGTRKISAEAGGMKPYNETVELKEKDKKNLSILLTELPKEETAAEEEGPAEQEKPKKGGGNKTLAYVSLGVGVVGVGVGAFMGLKAKSTKSEIDDKCKNGVCSEGERDLYDTGKTQATISTVGFIVGAVGIGVGTVLLLSGGSGKTEGKLSARRVTPYVGPRELGVFGNF